MGHEKARQNSGFVLKRAVIDGEENPEYTVVSSYLDNTSLVGAGTTTEQHIYDYRDSGIKPGVTYSYILEDVDHSGNITQHDPVTVKVPENVLFSNADFRLEPAYPNPFNPAFTVPLELSRAMDVNVAMYDITGKMVRRIAGSLRCRNYDFRRGRQ
ncbi:MAG: hypothetical protein U5N56_11685 [Candidatus Marinimicrobia bacterium]|nr:hypothetical protein [Candidatus Neomarinimicrobiota bacterium]